MATRTTPISLVLLGAAACTATQPPPPPPVATVTFPPAVEAPPPPPPPPPPRPPTFTPRAPFTLIARTAGNEDLFAFPLEDGAAILAAGDTDDIAHTLKLAVLDHDTIVKGPELATGRPRALFTDPPPVLGAGRWPGALWLTRGPTICEAYTWVPDQRTWAPRPGSPTPDLPCERLAAWTPGAAIGVVHRDAGPALIVFGPAPKVRPSLPPRRPGQPKDCAGLFGAIHHMFAYPSGEVMAIGMECDATRTWIARWARGSARADVVDAGLRADTTYYPVVHTPTRSSATASRARSA